MSRVVVTLPRFARVPPAWDLFNLIGKGSIVAKVQKVYTKEFKEEAVKLAQSSGKPVAQIARELGVSQ